MPVTQLATGRSADTLLDASDLEAVENRAPRHDRTLRLDRALARVQGLMLVSFLVVSVAPLASIPDPSFTQVFPRVVIAVAYLVVAIDMQFRGPRRLHLAILMAPYLSAALLEVDPYPGDVAPGLTTGAIALCAARLFTPAGYVGFIAPVAVVHGTARVLAGAEVNSVLSDLVVGIGMTLAVYAFANALHGAAQRSVLADERTQGERRAAAQQEADHRAVAAAGRALHDEVLVALRMVANRSEEPRRIRDACGTAVAAVDEISAEMRQMISTDGGDALPVADPLRVADLVREVRRDAPVHVRVQLAASAAQVRLSQDVHDAVLRAVREALRNVARHAGVDAAELHVGMSADLALQVEVVDHGVGLSGRGEPGFGTTSSIVQPVTDVGGSVAYRETLGGGTTLRLDVPLRLPVRRSWLAKAYDLTVRASGSARPIQEITWPVTAVWIYMSIRYSFEWPTPWVSLALAAAFTALTLMVLMVVPRRALTGTELFWIAGGLVALNAVSLTVAPDGALLDYRSWTIGYLAAPLVALVMVLPVGLGLAILVPLVAQLLAAAAFAPELSDGSIPWGSINAVVTTPVAAIVLGWLLRRIGRRIEAQDEDRTRIAVQRAVGRALHQIKSFHLDHTRRNVVPWLRRVAGGEVDLDAPATARQAELFGTEVRDDLFAPGLLSGDLRVLVTDFRRRGGSVNLRAGFPPGPPDPVVERVLRDLIAQLDVSHQVRITPSKGAVDAPTQVRFAVVPAVPEATVARLDQIGEVDHDEFRTVITVRTPAVVRRGVPLG